MLQNASLLAIIAIDTAENEPLNFRVISLLFQSYPREKLAALFVSIFALLADTLSACLDAHYTTRFSPLPHVWTSGFLFSFQGASAGVGVIVYKAFCRLWTTTEKYLGFYLLLEPRRV